MFRERDGFQELLILIWWEAAAPMAVLTDANFFISINLTINKLSTILKLQLGTSLHINLALFWSYSKVAHTQLGCHVNMASHARLGWAFQQTGSHRHGYCARRPTLPSSSCHAVPQNETEGANQRRRATNGSGGPQPFGRMPQKKGRRPLRSAASSSRPNEAEEAAATVAAP